MKSKNVYKTLSILLCILLVFSFNNYSYLFADSSDKLLAIDKEEDGILDELLDPEFRTDRFIVKFADKEDKGDKAKKDKSIKDKLKDKVKESKKLKVKDKEFEIVITNEKLKLNDFINEVMSEYSGDIEYIQPDYELAIASDDVYFNNQWGLKNNGNTSQYTYINDKYMQLEMYMPELRMLMDQDPIFCEELLKMSPQQLREMLENNKIPENIPPHIIMELADNPMIRDILDGTTQEIQVYNADANVVQAWGQSQGSGIIVAVIDTGIDINHEDLEANIWTNINEIPGNGIDDDGNGYIDDYNGWNFYGDNSQVYDISATAAEEHGTHIAGIIAAEKDNRVGIAGVAPSASIMPLKVFNKGKAYTSDIIEAIEYAETMGAKIVNCSWGGTNENPALKEAIEGSSMLFVCAAGNSGMSIDQIPVYPAAYDSANIISVAAINRQGMLTSASNYGEVAVDVAAPGEDILSTLPNNQYGNKSGTSMAAAFVAGEAALLYTQLGDSATVKQRIIESSDKLSSLIGMINGGYKINSGNSVYGVISNEIIEVGSQPVMNNDYTINPTSEDISLFAETNAEMGKIIQVSAGSNHTLALDENGIVWAWGDNTFGQLGDGTDIIRGMPIQVAGIEGIVSVAAGSYYSIALKNNGTVWVWGANFFGQLGDGTTTSRSVPVQIAGLEGVVSVAAREFHSIAIKNDGAMWTWGWNGYGQLGDGTTTNRSIPAQVVGLEGVVSVAAGVCHSIAVQSDGTVWAMGRNNSGELGDGSTVDRSAPAQVVGLEGVVSVAAGSGLSIALKGDGTVWTWGYNSYGQLGDGTTVKSSTPVQVVGLEGAVSVTAGMCHSIVIKSDGTVCAWGWNYYGQLGDGTTTSRSIPIQIADLEEVESVEAGYNHSIAIKNDGTVCAWGWNYYGQLGDGTYFMRSIPVQTVGLEGAVSVAVGQCHSIVMKSDGTVWAWGYNNYGQLGDGTTTSRSIPVQAVGLGGVVSVAAGYNHSIAIKSDGTVWAWGHNNCGQLGDGTTTGRSIPVQVVGLEGVVSVAAG